MPFRALGVDVTGLGGDPLAELSVFDGAETVAEVDARLRDEVRTIVEWIVALTSSHDAFDLIELLRLREIPIAPVLSLEPDYDGSGAVIELVTVVLLARGRRAGKRATGDDVQPHEVIPDLHAAAKRLLRLASFRHLRAQQASNGGRFERLAAEYQAFFVEVRNHQYKSVVETHDRALFDRPDASELLAEHLGYTYREFLAVRDAISETYSSEFLSRRDRSASVVEQNGPCTADEIESFRTDIIEMMFVPGSRASFTVAKIAEASDLPEPTVAAVLNSFSTDFARSDPVRAVLSFLHGRNPLDPASLVRDGTLHIMTGGPIGDDSFRTVAEKALKDSRAWTAYQKKIRSKVTEQIGNDSLERLLGRPPYAAPFRYVASKDGEAISTVDANCADPPRVGDLVEGDGLFVIDDVAVCLEVKGGSIPAAARRGDLVRLERETKKILGGAAGQARRLETLIRGNRGVWLEDGSWLDLSAIREIHTIVAELDTLGPLSVALGDLASASLLGDGQLPWIASLHDLDVISRTIDRPAEFLLYLRRRTDRTIADNYRGADELDLFMLFMDGHLYVEPDPEEIHRAHPRTSRPRVRDRRRHLEGARPTIVGTFTDDLDRWMYSIEGSSPFDAAKPTFNSHAAADEIVNLLEDNAAPGWLRCGADLLALSGDAQRRLGEAIDKLVDLTRNDGKWHDFCQGYAGNFGYPTFFAGCAPASLEAVEAVSRLRLYMQAKKHQVRSDRSLGLVFNGRRHAVAALYLNNPPGEDAGLDEIGNLIGLQHTWKHRSSSTAKKAKRQRKKARKRKRRR